MITVTTHTDQGIHTYNIADQVMHDMVKDMNQLEAESLREAGNPWGFSRAMVKCRELQIEYSQIIDETFIKTRDFICESVKKMWENATGCSSEEESMSKKYRKLLARRIAEDSANLAETFKKLADAEIAGTPIPLMDPVEMKPICVIPITPGFRNVFTEKAIAQLRIIQKIYALWHTDVTKGLRHVSENGKFPSEKDFATKFRCDIALQMQKIAGVYSKFKQ